MVSVVATLVLLLPVGRCQLAPCYQCEDYKANHPQSRPYSEIRSHCSYPCQCPPEVPLCSPGVPIIRDGCGCCPICALQVGDHCDGNSLCDDSRGLVCQYVASDSTSGVCKSTKGLPCNVHNRTYENGETFMMDCRTQCACQNGTYACASLCPQENISPRGSCKHPRLIEVPGQCCREWMCDSEPLQRPPECISKFSPWSPCSTTCGLGFSYRESNLNADCETRNETRLCQLRSCSNSFNVSARARHHHVRKGHECKATQRLISSTTLRFANCVSRRRYRPKYCGHCTRCCVPDLSTTIQVEFQCQGRSRVEDAQQGENMWFSIDLPLHGHHEVLIVNVHWTLKCQCSKSCDIPVTDSPFLPVLLHRVHRTAAP